MGNIMKKQKSYYLLYTCLLLLFTSCTEEISEAVKNNEVLSETETELAKFDDASIRVVSTSDSDLSHLLHKQGSLSEACELKSPALGFDADDYDRTSSNYTVDCILDVQEHDLYWQGADLQLQVDEYLCEYVQYQPYRFLQFQPGRTQKVQYQVECDQACGETSEVSPYCGNKYRTIGVVKNGSEVYTYALSNQSLQDPPLNSDSLYFNVNPSDADFTTMFSGKISSNEPLTCNFDYTNNDYIDGENCDEGYIETVVVRIESTPVTNAYCSGASGGDATTCGSNGGEWVEETIEVCDGSYSGSGIYPTLQVDETNSSKTDCGGSLSACVQGPANDHYEARYTSEIIYNEDTSEFEYDISIAAPYDKNYLSNIYAANFSRVCSSTSLSKTNADFDTSVTAIIGHEVEDIPSRTTHRTYSIDDNGDGVVDAYALGGHIYDGAAYYNSSNKNVQPYYAINCLDKARDIKAQIRIFIREWDRIFSENNNYIARLSDVNQSNALMDTMGDQTVGHPWNDYKDLDDILADYDMDPETDDDGDTDNFENAFLNNQCSELEFGHCYSKDTATDETTCNTTTPANSGHTGIWLRRLCVYDLDLLTNESSCDANGGTWAIDFCSDSQLLTESDCEAAGERWYSGNTLYPGFNL